MFFAVLGGPPNPPLTLVVQSPTSHSIPQSDLACSVIIKGLFHHFHITNEAQHPAFPHFTLKRQEWKDTLQEVSKSTKTVFYLIESGTPIDQVELDPSTPMAFILGDDRGIPSDHEEALKKINVKELSIGRQSYLGSQVVTLVLLELADRFNKSSLIPDR